MIKITYNRIGGIAHADIQADAREEANAVAEILSVLEGRFPATVGLSMTIETREPAPAPAPAPPATPDIS